MRLALTTFAVPVAVAFLALPSFAQDATTMDMSTMTCGQVKAMDQDKMLAASDEAMKMAAMSADELAKMKAMTPDEKAKMEADNKAKMDAMTADQKTEHAKMMDDSMSKLMAACGTDDSMLILDAAKTATKG